MFKPLRSPFFNVIGNRFAYLSHDDGFFCKLYCRELSDFAQVLNGKIVDFTKSVSKRKIENLDVRIQNKLLEISQEGLLLDFKDMFVGKDEIYIKIFSVGKYNDMDTVLNNIKQLKKNSLNVSYLKYKANKWYIEQTNA